MAMDPRLESYLTRLDKALGPVPVSDRADIVTEIKSHVLSAKERDSQRSMDSILDALGTPETVANRYLMERGLQPGKPPKHPMVKWLVIGFLGTFGISTLAILFLAWHFSPILKVDESEGRVEILGGLIKVHEDPDEVSIGGGQISLGGRKTEGVRHIWDPKSKELQIQFSNGKIGIENSSDGSLHWSCKVGPGTDSNILKENGRVYSLDVSNAAYSKCELQIPQHLTVSVKGANGKVGVRKPLFDFYADIDNGKITFSPDELRNYNYDIKIQNGSSEAFQSSTASDAFKVRVKLGNGKVGRG